MTRLRSAVGPALTIAAVALAVVALVAGAPRSAAVAVAQEEPEDEDQQSIERLMHDIRLLEMVRNLGLTGEQRAKAAAAIEGFHEKREAIQKLAQTPGLAAALKVVRDTLLAGQGPTDEMREAVELARPPDDGSIDRAFGEARDEVLLGLLAVLTDEQKAQLTMMPLVGLANEVIGMCMEAREIGGEEARELRTNAFAEVRDQLAFAAGDDADSVLADFQALINRISAMTPEQMEQEHEQFVGQIVALLSGTFEKNPEMVNERLKDQLWEWVVDPRMGVVLRESAQAMGAE